MSYPSPASTAVQHGVNCPKAKHYLKPSDYSGESHGADYDGPYDFAGLTYCGRCHVELNVFRCTQPVQPPSPQPSRAPLTFRNSRIVYYGPHACSNCGATICKMGSEFGGNAFTYPEGPIYPNTEWHAHVCDPKMVAKLRDLSGSPT